MSSDADTRAGDEPAVIGAVAAGGSPAALPAVGQCSESYEVGKYYRVPCVLTHKHSWLGSGWQPIIGPMHEDSGVVNFPYDHWHIDLRFVDGRRYKGRIQILSPYTWPILKNDRYGGEVVKQGPEMKRLRCKRVFPPYPHDQAKWLPALQEEFCAVKMKNMVCPHRGLPLEGCPRDGDVVQCPGHGLRWNVITGELVK